MRRKLFFTLPVFLACLLSLCFGNVRAAEKAHLYHDLFSVSFPTERDGWACGRWGTILHSEDGGKSWERQQSGTDFTLGSIYFVDSRNGWAVGDGGIILHSADGGKSWEKQQGPMISVFRGRKWGDSGEVEAGEQAPLSFFLMGVHFANELTGWIVTERTTILHTADGGRSWQVQFSDEDFILKSVSFWDDRHGWAVGEFGYIYHTDNGGETWEHQAGYFDISDETGDMVGGNFLFDVVALSPRGAWVAGIDGYVARTGDGGKTWEEVKPGTPKSHLFGVTGDGADRIFLGGNATLLGSLDRGETFRAMEAEPPITYGWLYDMVPRGEAGFVFVGKKGWIYLTAQEGKVWKKVSY